MDIRVKICGLKDKAHVVAAVEAGATYLGFNFFPKSPRYVEPSHVADLAQHVPAGIAKVALVVNASDAELDALIDAAPFDMLQLHGSESAARVSDVKARYGLPVMKVLGIAERADLAALDTFQTVADQILVDAKPPRDAVLPGGNGLTFDWTLLPGLVWRKPWMLAGGLTPENVALAIRSTNSRQVDVSSGVETAPGVKNANLIRAFVAAAKSAVPA